MDNNWFIFEGDHHLGPFSFEEIVQMYQEDRVSKDVMVWKAGNAGWQYIYECAAFEEYFRNNRDNENLLGRNFSARFSRFRCQGWDDKRSSDQAKQVGFFAGQDDRSDGQQELDPTRTVATDQPPPLDFISEVKAQDNSTDSITNVGEGGLQQDAFPTESTNGESTYSSSLDKGDKIDKVDRSDNRDRIGESEDNGNKIGKIKYITESDIEQLERVEKLYRPLFPDSIAKGIHPLWVKTIIAVLPLVTLIAAIKFVNSAKHSENGFLDIPASAKQQLQKVQTIGENKKFIMQFALSKDGNSIWASSNRSGPATVYLTLTSVDNKILSQDKVIITSKAMLENHNVQFKLLKIIEGDGLVPGYYQLRVTAIETGLNTKLYSFLKSINLMKTLALNYSYQDELLLYQGTGATFDEKLTQHRKQLFSKEIQPLRDMLEKYRTFSVILDNLDTMYQEELSKIKSGVQIIDFERQYSQQIGPILQGIILDNDKIHISLLNINPKMAEDYKELFLYGRQIGVFVSDIVTKTKKKDKSFGEEVKHSLLNEFQEDLTILKEMGDIRIRRLHQNISNIESMI